MYSIHTDTHSLRYYGSFHAPSVSVVKRWFRLAFSMPRFFLVELSSVSFKVRGIIYRPVGLSSHFIVTRTANTGLHSMLRMKRPVDRDISSQFMLFSQLIVASLVLLLANRGCWCRSQCIDERLHARDSKWALRVYCRDYSKIRVCRHLIRSVRTEFEVNLARWLSS